MELLLNLAWLLLVVPALWIWHTTGSDRDAGKRPPALLILGCVLILLFPVVSATDDLQAMQPEMEEAAVRDGLGSSHHGKFLTSVQGQGSLFALLAARHPLRPTPSVWRYTMVTAELPSATNSVTACPGRAPPASLLG
jgi:hypothetical protein